MIPFLKFFQTPNTCTCGCQDDYSEFHGFHYRSSETFWAIKDFYVVVFDPFVEDLAHITSVLLQKGRDFVKGFKGNSEPTRCQCGGFEKDEF